MAQTARGLLLAALAITSTQLAAQSHTSNPYRPKNVAGWVISPLEDADGSCFMETSFEGHSPTELTLVINYEGVPSLIVANESWTIKNGEEYQIDYELFGGAYAKHPTLGGSGGSLVTRFEKSFVDYFSKSNYLHLIRDGVIVDRLSLKGSAAAVAEVRRCIAHIQRQADAINRERRKFEDIPANPFSDR